MSARLRQFAIPVAAATAAGTAGAHLVNFALLDLRSAALDADANWGISDTVSVVAVAIATLAVAVMAVHRLALLPLAGLLAFLTLDDAIQVHQHIGFAWELAIVLPVAAWLIVLSYSTEDAAGRLLRLAVAFLALSLVLGDIGPLAHLAGWATMEWEVQLEAALKQAAEMAGWVLLAFGAVLAARAQGLAARPDLRS